MAGSQIDFGVFAPNPDLDPAFASGGLVGGSEIASIYDVLFTYDHESQEFEPKLAESLEPNDDFTVWTLRLREGITYSDGTVLDAQLVSDNLDRFFQPGVRNNLAGFLSMITEKNVIDERTLEFRLGMPSAEFPSTFVGLAGSVVNLAAVGDEREAFGMHPPDEAGLGPYVVERNAPGEELVLRARPDYWDGPVCVETLRFVFVPGAQATYESFQAGQLNMAFLRDEIVIESASDEEGFFVAMDAGAVILFNHAADRPGADPRVREAMLLAIDEEVINERAYQGTLTASKALIAPGSRFHSEAVEEFPTDADRARALLDQARADGFDGRVEVVCADTRPSPETALATEAMLEAVGFEVDVRLIATSDQIAEVFQGNFDGACWGFNAGPANAHQAYWRNLHSEMNQIGYASAEMDEALVDMLAAGEDELEEAFAEVNRVFHDDAVSLSFGAPRQGVIWQPEIGGVQFTAVNVTLFDKAYIEQ